MEEPLITEESSSGGGRRRSGGNVHQRSYQRRSDAIAYGTRYQKAAALVDLVSLFNEFLILFYESLFCSVI